MFSRATRDPEEEGMSYATKKGSSGELDLRDLLIAAGHAKAYRVGHQQRVPGPKPPDVEGTPYYTENKSQRDIPLALWRYIEQCLESRPPADQRPVLLRLKRTGRQYPPLIVMIEAEWLTLERARLAATSSSRSDGAAPSPAPPAPSSTPCEKATETARRSRSGASARPR